LKWSFTKKVNKETILKGILITFTNKTHSLLQIPTQSKCTNNTYMYQRKPGHNGRKKISFLHLNH